VAPKLRFVVILTRHGVRITHLDPGRPKHVLQPTLAGLGSRARAPDTQGYKLMTLWALITGSTSLTLACFASTGLPQDGNHLHILADSESRTLETGKALAAGMAPECGTRTQTVSERKRSASQPACCAASVIQTVRSHSLLSLEGSAATLTP